MSSNSNDTSKTFYILGLGVILIGVVVNDIILNPLAYSLFGIGVLLLVLGLYDAIKHV